MIQASRLTPVVLGVLSLMCAFRPAFAQATGTPSIPRAEELKQQVPQETKPEASVRDLRALPREVGKPSDDIRVNVTRYEIIGGTPELDAAVPALLTPFVGNARTFEDLTNAATALTRYMQAELGLYLAYAYLPEQSIEGGVVKIAVLSGVLDRVVLNWKDGILVDRSVVEDHLAALKPGSVIRVSEIERVVFLLNDLRGISLNFEIQPGSKPGTAALVVTPMAQNRFSGRVGFDVNGARFVGTNRISATASVESPLGRGDALTLNHLRSTNNALDFSLLSYTSPIGSDGFKLGGSVARVNYELPTSQFPLGLNGESTVKSLFALYPFVRSRNFNLFGTVSQDQKDYIDRLSVVGIANERRIDTVQAGISSDSRDDLLGGGINSFEIGYVSGVTNYVTGRAPGLEDAATFKKTTYGATRLQSIVPNRLLLLTSIKGQSARQNLDVSEECRLGGPDGVRSFAPGEGAGDSCNQGTVELRYLPTEKLLGSYAKDFSFGLFYDYGKTRISKDPSLRPANFVNERTLSGYGVGVLWNPSPLTTLKTSLGWEAKGQPEADPKRDVPRIYMSFQTGF